MRVEGIHVRWLRYYLATERHDAQPCRCQSGYLRDPKLRPGCGIYARRMHVKLQLGPDQCPEPDFARLSVNGLERALEAWMMSDT